MNKKKKRAYNRQPLDKSLVPALLALPVHVLHDSYHWGSKKRLPNFVEKMLLALKELEDGKLEVADLIEEFESLTGVKIK